MNNLPVEENLQAASEGNQAALEKVLKGILTGPLYIPDRVQSHKLSHQPVYPNDIVNIMGIQDKERVIVPAFTSATLIENWFGSALQHRTFTGAGIFSVLPEGWWICINPGQEVEKDLSPWEISKLKEGENGIKEIIAEISSDDSIVQSISIAPLPENEFLDLKKKLIDFAVKDSEILSLYILKEKSLTIDEQVLEKVLIGAECNKNQDEIERTKDALQSICDLNLIGNTGSKVLAATPGNNIILGVFKGTAPFYKSEISFLKKIIKVF